LIMPGEDGGYGGVILPKPADTLYVFDEGHHLPGKAVDRGASRVHLEVARRQLGRLTRQALAAYSFTDKARLGKLDAQAAEEKLQQLADALEELERDIGTTWTPNPAEREPVWRASLGQLPVSWIAHAQALCVLTVDIQRWLTNVRRAVLEMTEGGPTREALARELGIALERIAHQADTWIAWAREDDADVPPTARWVTRTNEGQVICHASNVSAAAWLRDALWDNA